METTTLPDQQGSSRWRRRRVTIVGVAAVAAGLVAVGAAIAGTSGPRTIVRHESPSVPAAADPVTVQAPAAPPATPSPHVPATDSAYQATFQQDYVPPPGPAGGSAAAPAGDPQIVTANSTGSSNASSGNASQSNHGHSSSGEANSGSGDVNP